MTIQEPIKLRGHHVAELSISRDVHPFLLPIYKLAMWVASKTDKNPKNFPEANKAFDKVVYKFIKDKDFEMEVVDGLDSICANCPLKNSKHCSKPLEYDEDYFCLAMYDLEVGKTYTVADLRKRMAIYSSKTGFDNPRNQFRYPALNERIFVREMIDRRLKKDIGTKQG